VSFVLGLRTQYDFLIVFVKEKLLGASGELLINIRG
jgi:hypothetical protein